MCPIPVADSPRPRYFETLDEARVSRDRVVAPSEPSLFQRQSRHPERRAWIEEYREGKWVRLGGADGEVVLKD